LFNQFGIAGEEGLRRLTSREVQVIVLASAGLTDKETADRIGVSLGTVTTMWANIRSKLGIGSRSAAVASLAWSIAMVCGKTIQGPDSTEPGTSKFLLTEKLVILACDNNAKRDLGLVPGLKLEGQMLPWSHFGYLDADTELCGDCLPWTTALKAKADLTVKLKLATPTGRSANYLVRCKVNQDPVLKTTVYVEIRPLG
jgi:DNA-binding CsgD family transcriptional regulator